jgi:hypothetical protein
MAEREVIETRGDFRAVIERDEYPEAPDWDGLLEHYAPATMTTEAGQ